MHAYFEAATDEFLAGRYAFALEYLKLAQGDRPDESASPVGLTWAEIRKMIHDARDGAHIYA